MAQALRSEPARPALEGGDPRVVAHPAFRDVPKCLFPLRSVEAQAEYDTLARLLFNAGRLTVGAHRDLSSYAMQFDNITMAPADNRQPRGSWFAQMDKARSRLNLDDLDKPIAAPEQAAANRFSRVGFSSRRR